MTDNNELYKRQQELDVKPPETVTIIGVGGVGSWTALDIALAGAEKVFVVDFDEIEEHNLNRTPFKTTQIGDQKTKAVAELIAERRIDAEVIPINKRIEDVAGQFREEMAESMVIDCRDHAEPLPDDIQDQTVLTAGYDGYQFTLHVHPDYEKLWGDENTEYETVPSFIAPPQFVSSLLTVIACTPELIHDLEENVESGDMRSLLQDQFFNGGDQ